MLQKFLNKNASELRDNNKFICHKNSRPEVSVEKVSLKISQYSQEYTCVGVSF